MAIFEETKNDALTPQNRHDIQECLGLINNGYFVVVAPSCCLEELTRILKMDSRCICFSTHLLLQKGIDFVITDIENELREKPEANILTIIHDTSIYSFPEVTDVKFVNDEELVELTPNLQEVFIDLYWESYIGRVLKANFGNKIPDFDNSDRIKWHRAE